MTPDYDRIRSLVEGRLADLFTDGPNPIMTEFNDINNYSLLSGGKRLRPVLLYGVNEALGGDPEDAMSLALSIEMIHTYSLIHDDLPAMDDDRYRRGRLTAHVQYGEAMAILSGDALLNRAYEVLFTRLQSTRMPETYAKACGFLAEAAGTKGMIGGQVADVKTENEPIPHETLDFIIEHKTGKLLVAALVCGAIVGGMTGDDLGVFHEAAQRIGYSFQLVDDYLDVTGDAKILGKATGRDQEMGKNTYVKYHGAEKTLQDAHQLLTEAKSLLEGITGAQIPLIYDIIEFLKNRNR